MNWLESLLWDPTSVAHIVCLYAFVISVGVLLGKIKVFGVSLGVTFVLFTGILMGHFGFTGEIHILHFIREFGLILFVFCIGLQVGPSFFSSFKKGGMTLNMLAVGIVALNIAIHHFYKLYQNLENTRAWKKWSDGTLEGNERRPDFIPSNPDIVYRNDGWISWSDWETDRKSTRLNSSHSGESRMPSSA